MPEQQSLMLYIAGGSGFKNGFRLQFPKSGYIAPWQQAKNSSFLPKMAWKGSEAASKVRLLAPKMAQNRLTSFRNQLRGCTYNLPFLCSRICRMGPCFWSVFLEVGGLCLTPIIPIPRVRATDRHCRKMRRNNKFGAKNINLATTIGERKIASEIFCLASESSPPATSHCLVSMCILIVN